MPYAPSKLPSITRFLTGLITNRNPVDTPFSLLGLNVVQHHDVLIDGLNTEVSAYDTMQRRPGFESFISGSAKDIWQYKDLLGNISLFVDTGTTLNLNGSVVYSNFVGAGPWTLQGDGNFLYAVNGVDAIRMQNTSLTTPTTWGQKTPQIPLQVNLQSLSYFNSVTGFTPSTDTISGLMVITDPSNQRTLTITINSIGIHFNVTYTGNQISPNQSYTQLTTQTQTGSPPNTATTDVVTVVNGYTDTITGSGISNGITQYFPNTGVSTLDFDYAYTAPMTLSTLSAAINAMNLVEFFTQRVNLPTTAAELLEVFATTTLVAGLWWSPGQSPVASQTGEALNINYAPTYGANSSGALITVSSGLSDTTNPQLSLGASIGISPRLYQYTSPTANVTDLLTGSITLSLVGASTSTTSFTFTNQTLKQIALGLESSHWNPVYVQTGTTAYIVLRNFQAASPSTTQDIVLVMAANTLVNNNDVNENWQNWIFTNTNDYPQQPQQGVEIVYATRDINSGGLSNVSYPVTIGQQSYPCRWTTSLILPSVLYNHVTTNIEVYRTVDGGSSYNYEQLCAYQNGTTYETSFSIDDDGLNEQIIGPIDEENDPPPRGLMGVVSHTERLWGFVNNASGARVYYSGGPDTANGNGDEAWPPGNYFSYPGLITSIKSIDGALIVALTDDLHHITGVDSSSYYTKPWMVGFGLSNPNAWVADAGSLYVYTTKQQLHRLGPDGAKEIGFGIGDQLLANFPASTTSLTFHRGSSLDTALYVSNGTSAVFRYTQARGAWSPVANPLVGAGRVKSLETTTGINTLLNSTTGGVWTRSLTIFADNGAAYPAFFTLGVMPLASLGMRALLNNVGMQLTALGSVPQVWVLFNEINDSFVPFTRLINPQNDPTDAPPSQSLWMKRWYTQQTITPFPTGNGLINLASIKVVFSSTDTVKNEVLGVFLRDAI